MTEINGYQLGPLLGQGTYGETYSATKDGQRVALKLIREEIGVRLLRCMVGCLSLLLLSGCHTIAPNDRSYHAGSRTVLAVYDNDYLIGPTYVMLDDGLLWRMAPVLVPTALVGTRLTMWNFEDEDQCPFLVYWKDYPTSILEISACATPLVLHTHAILEFIESGKSWDRRNILRLADGSRWQLQNTSWNVTSRWKGDRVSVDNHAVGLYTLLNHEELKSVAVAPVDEERRIVD